MNISWLSDPRHCFALLRSQRSNLKDAFLEITVMLVLLVLPYTFHGSVILDWIKAGVFCGACRIGKNFTEVTRL